MSRRSTRTPTQATSTITSDLNLQRTLDFLNGLITLGPGDLASDTDNVWTDVAAVDAHAYAGYVYDYFRSEPAANPGFPERPDHARAGRPRERHRQRLDRCRGGRRARLRRLRLRLLPI